MYKNENKNIIYIYRERNNNKKCVREEKPVFVHTQLVTTQEKYVFREWRKRRMYNVRVFVTSHLSWKILSLTKSDVMITCKSSILRFVKTRIKWKIKSLFTQKWVNGKNFFFSLDRGIFRRRHTFCENTLYNWSFSATARVTCFCVIF